MDENKSKPFPLELLDEVEEDYGDVVGVGDEGIGKRLHASRLAAGIIMAVDAAKIIGMNAGSYRHAEHGYRPTHEALVKAASALYGVSDDFLRVATAVAERDRLAARLVEVLMPKLMTPEDIEDDDDFEALEEDPKLALNVEAVWRNRFREMRTAAGYESPAAMASAYGWNRYTTWQHETGTRGISRDRMIGYALALGVRPEWAVNGEGDMLELEPVQWQELDRKGRPLVPLVEPGAGPSPR